MFSKSKTKAPTNHTAPVPIHRDIKGVEIREGDVVRVDVTVALVTCAGWLHISEDSFREGMYLTDAQIAGCEVLGRAVAPLVKVVFRKSRLGPVIEDHFFVREIGDGLGIVYPVTPTGEVQAIDTLLPSLMTVASMALIEARVDR